MDFESYLTQTIEKAVKEAIKEEFEEVYETIRIATEPPYMNTNQAMELTGWSRRTLQYLRDTKQVDFVQHGRKILYPTKAFYDFLESCKLKRAVKK